MTYKVAAFYNFVALPDFRDLRKPLKARCDALDICGTILLAEEGINATVAGTAHAVDSLIAELRTGSLFGGRLSSLEVKYSTAQERPFERMKIRLKKEIVTLRRPDADPTKQVGTYVEPADWNALIQDPEVLVIDTRNHFEVEMGSFRGARDPNTRSFGEFADFVRRELDLEKNRKIAMYCTGGIRCEKATAYMLSQGFENVFHLKGGILNYLEKVPRAQSLWQGDCFVFDERVALTHELVEAAPSNARKTS